MGIIIQDTISTRTGDYSNVYASLGKSRVGTMKKDNGNFLIRSQATIWKSQTDRNNNKGPIGSVGLALPEKTAEELKTLDYYDALYTVLKAKYTNTVDA